MALVHRQRDGADTILNGGGISSTIETPVHDVM
jgi:hypothetical protein